MMFSLPLKEANSSAITVISFVCDRVCATHSSRNVVLTEPATPPTPDTAAFRPTIPPQFRHHLQSGVATADNRSLFSMPSIEDVR